MRKKTTWIKFIVPFAVALTACAFAACGEEKAEISAKTDYAVVKVGDTFTLPVLKATDGAGNAYETAVSVKDENGASVALTDGKFLAQTGGKYTAEYTYKDSEPFLFSVYAYADGREYDVVVDGFTPETEMEWNTQMLLQPLTAKSRVTGKTFSATPTVEYGGETVGVSANVFLATELGAYTVTYTYQDAVYSYGIECVCTSAPEIYVKNSATVSPDYGEDFLLPYYDVAYPESRVTEKRIAVYAYGDENESVDLFGIRNNRFVVGTARFYIYAVTVDYVDHFGQDQTYTREFVIKRAYDDVLDRVDAWVDGDTLQWRDRNDVVNAAFGANDYYAVTGYEISTDGGQTFVDCGEELQYVFTETEMCSAIVREKRAFAGNGNDEKLVATSNPVYYDGAAAKTVVSSFDDPLYEKTLAYNSFAGYEWDNKNSMSYSVRSEQDGRTGVLFMKTTSWTGLKIDFAKTSVLGAGDVLGITLKFVPAKTDQPHEYENSNVYAVRYGSEDYPHTTGYNLFDAGLVVNEWCTVYLDVKETLGESVGSVVRGIELCVIVGGTLYVDEIRYYAGEEYNTFNAPYHLGQVGYSGARYDDSVAEAQNDVKNRYYYFGQEDAGNRSVAILEDGYAGSQSGVLKFAYDLYGSLGVKFAKPQTVTANLTIDVVYYYAPENDKTFIVSKYGADALTLDVTDFAKTGMWTHMLVKAIDLGYEIGDTIDGIDLYVSYDAGELYIDEIFYFEQTPLSGGTVASFNYGYYSSNLVAPGAQWSDGTSEEALLKNAYEYYFNNDVPEHNVKKTQYEIVTDGYEESDGGVLKVTYDIRGSIGIAFMETETVTATMAITVRLYYSDVFLYVSKFGADGLGVKVENLTQYEWIDVTVLAADLGYSVGDTIDGVDLYFGEYDGTVYIDYIKVTNA